MATQIETQPLSPQQITGSGLCIGCGSCVAQEKEATVGMGFNRYGQYQPSGDVLWLNTPSEAFSRTCPFSPGAANEDEIAAAVFPAAPHNDAQIGRYISAYVGYAAEAGFRDRGSSGGLVSWVLAALMREGLIDGAVHVVPVSAPQEEGGRFFKYRISRSLEEINAGAKSRYYPVELSGALEEIRATPGRYAVVGVPCFIKAIQLLLREHEVLRERIVFTLGLFCGHMKSARLVESFALQMGLDTSQITAAEFRIKDPTRPASTYTAQFTLQDGSTVRKDWWFLTEGDWGSGFFQYSACNFCDDVVGETADISFGDAWVEPYSSDGRGTNVVITRSPELARLISDGIEAGRLQLEGVDAEFVAATQAAGFRQRREGLAYRLTWPKRGIKPVKRVAPGSSTLTRRRKLIYRCRAHISVWSHRLFWLGRALHRPTLYWKWGWAALAVYQGLSYSRGKIGEFFDRVLKQ